VKVRTIAVAKLRITPGCQRFENDRVEAVVELEPGDEVDVAIAHAHRVVDDALAFDPKKALAGQRRATPARPGADLPERPIEPYGDPRPRK
jgi:hypothetical protein